MSANDPKQLQGNLVIASPQLADPNFHRTVVLMIQHSEEGAFGVVLNRPSDRTIHEVWEKVGESPCENQAKIHLGGPVVGPLMAVHSTELFSDLEILPGVFFTTEKEKLTQLVSAGDEGYLLIIGYAGWAGGQLENEMETGSWITTPATAEYIFCQEENLWEKVTKDLTDSVLFSTLKIKQAPQDPSLN